MYLFLRLGASERPAPPPLAPARPSHRKGSSRIAKKVKKKRRTFKQIRISETRSIAIHLTSACEMNNLDPDGLLEPHAAVCVYFPFVTTRGRWAVPLCPHPNPVSIHWTGPRAGVRSGLGWLGRQTLPPSPQPSWVGEAWAARRAGLREEVAASVRPLGLGDESRGTRPPKNRQGISALPCPSKGPGPLLFPRVTLGHMLLNL